MSIALLIPSFSYTMKEKKITAFFLLHDKERLEATNQNCRLMYPDGKSIIFYDKPVYQAFMDNDKRRVGLIGDDDFLVYDVKTVKEIWRYHIPRTQDYSVAFSTVDDTIFLRDGNNLIQSDSKLPILLALAEPNHIFGITPHPTKKAVFYPSCNKTLRLYSLDGSPATHIPGTIGRNAICSAYYSPYGPYVVLGAENNKVFIRNTMTQEISECLPTSPQEIFCADQFLHHSSLLVLLGGSNLYFFDCSKLDCNQNDPILTVNLDSSGIVIQTDCPLFDISPDSATYAAVDTNNRWSCTKPIPSMIRYILSKNRTNFLYWILKNYSEKEKDLLPLDILGLLVRQLLVLYNSIA